MDLDEAALRRLTKRIYITLPDSEARIGALKKSLQQVKSKVSKKEFDLIAQHTKNYSFADLSALVKDAAMGPIRDIQ